MDVTCTDSVNCPLIASDPTVDDIAIQDALSNLQQSAQLLENAAYGLAGVLDAGFVATLMLLSKSCSDAVDRLDTIDTNDAVRRA